jgi:diguanylate cyclase (GGDEF)-like protein
VSVGQDAGRLTQFVQVALAGGAVALFAALTWTFEGEAIGWTAFDDIGELLAAMIATAACSIRVGRERLLYSSMLKLQRARSASTFDVALQRQTRTAWTLLALGMGAWAVGQAGWSVYEIGLGITPPSPSWLDAFFLSSSVLVIAGLLAMVRTPAGYISHLRGAVEALFIAAGCVLLSWSLIGPTIVSGEVLTFGYVVNLAYPALDAVALAAVLFVAARRGGDPLSGLGLLGLGIACLAASDSAFSYLSAHGGVAGATPLDTGWVAGFLLIALAALKRGMASRWQHRIAASRLTLALPALPAATGMAVTLGQALANGGVRSETALIGILAVLAALGTALLSIVSYENRALIEHLERRVEEGTAELRHQAFHDPLTGLANRALLADRATQAFARARRAGTSVAMIVLDLDAFKLVNDRLGHHGGDLLLRSIAQRLQDAVRPQDTVARIGGDEFAILMDSASQPQDAVALAQRVNEAMHPPFELGGSRQTMTASIGVAVDHAPNTNFEQLLCDADVAMYAVKSAERDAVALFQSSMHEQARERLHLHSELREGLERGEFWVAYQPEFDSQGRRLVGFEALLRWDNPKRGPMEPERFIPLAEETGLIVPLGRWVLREALREAVGWEAPSDTGEPLSISVNVSGVQLGAPSFLGDVQEALEQAGIDPGRVVLEITESCLVDNSPRTVAVLHSLKALGVRIAIDDFGTGYASISYLQSIPVDILKVDRSFVSAGEAGKRRDELLGAIVNIGHVLSLTTVAEGVEQPSQLSTVNEAGCDLVQGHLLSQPLPQEDVQRLIAEHATRPRPRGAEAQAVGVGDARSVGVGAEAERGHHPGVV